MNAQRQKSWQTLLEAGLVTGSIPNSQSLESPWYVRLMLGMAGWIAALFLLGFVAAGLSWVIDTDFASISTGIIMIIAAWLILLRIGHNDFAAQFALALSFAGQVLLANGLFDQLYAGRGDTAHLLVMALIQSVLAVVMPNAIHRLWSAFAAAIAFSMALHSISLYFVHPAIIMALASWTWLNEFRWPQRGNIIRPLAYGLILALLVIVIATSYVGHSQQSLLEPWIGELLLGAVLLWVVWVLLRRSQMAVPGRFANAVLIGTAVLVLVSLKAPGISMGAAIILLGYAHGNRILTGLGIAALLLYISNYYYNLDATLLVKSQVLALTGAILLVLRWLLIRWLMRNPEPDHG